MPMPAPLVSAVIPTHRRPDLVVNAARSALAQTIRDLEVIVVIDGADDAAARALAMIDDARLRILVSATAVGNSEARNLGVAGSRAEWVAFLDDDDLWLPRKIERQLETARRSPRSCPIVGCRLIARTESHEFTWPRRPPAPGEQLSEYLFCRRTLFSGEGVMPTSTIFTRRKLLEEVPFRKDLRKHVDPDWLLRAVARSDAGVEFVPDPEPLAIWHIEEGRPRISNDVAWQYSRDWIRANRDLVTPRAYAAFLLTVASQGASRARDWRAFPMLLWEAGRFGRPAIVDVGAHLGNFLTPDWMRRRAVPGRRTKPCASSQ